MAPKFGTSGLRGLVRELTDELVADHIRAFLTSCDIGPALYLGRDLRDSSPHLAQVVAQTANAMGHNVVDCGALPTPALALAAQSAGAGAVMITGSHIPADRNGLKFYTPRGEITKSEETAILASLGQADPQKTAMISQDLSAITRFQDRYLTAFGPGALAGALIGVYSHSSVGRDVLIDILIELGALVVELGRADGFVPVDTEAVDAQTRAQLLEWAAQHSLDAIVSTDGDADRPLLTDAAGQIVTGDIMGQITAQFLAADTVVTPVSSNSGVSLGGQFQRVIRCKIGSPYVISAMEKEASHRVVGYEANGGFLLGFEANGPGGPLPALATRDCMLPLLATLVAARGAEGIDIAARVAQEPARFTASDRLTETPSETSTQLIADLTSDPIAQGHLLRAIGLASGPSETLPAALQIDTTDGLRITAEDGSILHLRPSGNAPEFRVYIEADDPSKANALLMAALSELSARLKP